MIRMEMEKPKKCISCPFKAAYFEHVNAIFYCIAAEKRRIGGARAALGDLPEWCPIKEEQ